MTTAIMYHYVRPPSVALPFFRHLDVESFRMQLAHFEKHFGFVKKDLFLESLRNGKPVPGVVLTFDDGFCDHARHVLPLLRDRGLWGIFYVPTGALARSRLLNVHRIHLLLGLHGGKAIAAELERILSDDMLTHGKVEEFRILTYQRQNNDEYTNFVKRSLNYFIDERHREAVLDGLMRAFVLDERAWVREFYMDEQGWRELHASGMLVGSHTISHPVLSTLNSSRQREEIEGSFNAIESVIGPLPVRTFCYPYGGFHSFTAETEAILADVGCLFSFNVERREISERDLRLRPQALPRFDCNVFPHGASYEIAG